MNLGEGCMKVWITISEDTLRRAIGEGFVAIGLTKRASQESIYEWDIATTEINFMKLETFQVTITKGW